MGKIELLELIDILMKEVVSLENAKTELVLLQRFDIAKDLRKSLKQLRGIIRKAELLLSENETEGGDKDGK